MQQNHRHDDIIPPIARLEARILLVEDDRLTQQLLKKSLEEAGAQVEAAADCAQAREILARDPAWPQIVLLDQSLPDGTGSDLTAQIRATPDISADLAILGLTGYHDSALADIWQGNGANRVLVKPVRGIVLRSILASYLPQEVSPTSASTAKLTDFPHLFEADLIQELLSEMGQGPTLSFMHRALSESVMILTPIPGEDDLGLRRRLHSALGATGMTGLSGLTNAIKALQNAVHTNGDREPLKANLQSCAQATQSAIEHTFRKVS